MKKLKSLAFGVICTFSFALCAGQIEQQAANDLLDVMQFEKQIDNSIEASIQMVLKADRKNAKKEKKIRALFAKLYNVSELRTFLSTSYAERFTLDELQDLIHFYNTPTGQKYAEILPEITSLLIQEQQKVMEKHMDELVELMSH